jgi:hypothetical protein
MPFGRFRSKLAISGYPIVTKGTSSSISWENLLSTDAKNSTKKPQTDEQQNSQTGKNPAISPKNLQENGKAPPSESPDDGGLHRPSKKPELAQKNSKLAKNLKNPK